MSKKMVTLGQMREQLTEYGHFHLEAKNILYPMDIYADFYHVAVSIGGSPYIVLKGKESTIVLSHIEAIDSVKIENGARYRIQCLDYGNTPLSALTCELTCTR